MPDLLTPLSDLCQTQLDTSRRMNDAVFSSTGKLDRILLDFTYRAFDDQLRLAQATGNTRDLQVLATLQATFWSAKPDQVQSLQKEFMRILAEMQNELGRVSQAFIEQFSAISLRAVPASLSQSGAAPNRTSSASMPFAPMISAWQTAMQGVAQLARRTMASMQQVSKATGSAVRSGTSMSGTSVNPGSASEDVRAPMDSKTNQGRKNENENENRNRHGSGHGNINGKGHVDGNSHASAD